MNVCASFLSPVPFVGLLVVVVGACWSWSLATGLAVARRAIVSVHGVPSSAAFLWILLECIVHGQSGASHLGPGFILGLLLAELGASLLSIYLVTGDFIANIWANALGWIGIVLVGLAAAGPLKVAA